MSFSAILRISLLFTIGATYVFCKPTEKSLKSALDKSIDFKEYASDKGRWDFVMSNRKEVNGIKVKKMSLLNQPSTTSFFDTKLQYLTTKGETKTLLNEQIEDKKDGTVIGTVKDKNGKKETFTISILKYIPKKLLYYHVKDNAKDKGVPENRYVIAHGKKLDKDSIKVLNEIDKKVGFETKLKKLWQ